MYKLGALPSGHSPKDYSGEKLFKSIGKLPSIPTSCDWSTTMTRPLGMMGNDQYGSCTCASISHLVNSWRGVHGLKQGVTASEVLNAYFDLTENKDTGLPLRPVLDYFRGKKEKSIGKHRCAGFVRLDHRNIEAIRTAIALFGGAYVAFVGPNNLTDMATWATEAPGWRANQANGHCIPFVGYDSKRFRAASWGNTPWMSVGYFVKYGIEAWCVISPDWWNMKAEAPSGLKLADTMQALQGIAA